MHNRYFRTLLLFTTIVFAVSCNDETETKQPAETISPSTMSAIPEMPVLLVNQYPHKETAYTEGLQFEDGVMYESTGQYGRSYLYKYELGSGKILNEYKLGNEYFGEGMTVWGDTIYMLSYREHTGFLFDKKSFRLLGKFRLNANEGWGLTHDSTHLVYSDGTPQLYFMDRKTFKEVRSIQVTNNYGPIPNINELEYINGYIYANVYETEKILKIDPNTGKVVAEADLGRLRTQAGIPGTSHRNGEPEVMNGIAYDKEKNRILITGKNWPRILEVKLDN